MPGAVAAWWACNWTVSVVTRRPVAAEISLAEMAPGRRILGESGSLRSRMVDSRPISHGPPSMMKGTFSPNESATCSARVGEDTDEGDCPGNILGADPPGRSPAQKKSQE